MFPLSRRGLVAGYVSRRIRRSASAMRTGREKATTWLAMSVYGTFRTCRDVRVESAFGGKPEVGFQGGHVAF
jgi:hypothetical protein